MEVTLCAPIALLVTNCSFSGGGGEPRLWLAKEQPQHACITFFIRRFLGGNAIPEWRSEGNTLIPLRCRVESLMLRADRKS